MDYGNDVLHDPFFFFYAGCSIFFLLLTIFGFTGRIFIIWFCRWKIYRVCVEEGRIILYFGRCGGADWIMRGGGVGNDKFFILVFTHRFFFLNIRYLAP